MEGFHPGTGAGPQESGIDKIPLRRFLSRPRSMLEILLLVACFVVVVFGLGPALVPVGFGSPLQRAAVGVAASLVLVYLLAFGLYVANLPKDAHWVIPGLAAVVAVLRR